MGRRKRRERASERKWEEVVHTRDLSNTMQVSSSFYQTQVSQLGHGILYVTK